MIDSFHGRLPTLITLTTHAIFIKFFETFAQGALISDFDLIERKIGEEIYEFVFSTADLLGIENHRCFCWQQNMEL